MATSLVCIGIGLVAIGLVVYLNARYYAWIGRPRQHGDNPLFRGWRAGVKVDIFISKTAMLTGAALILIGIGMTAITG